MRRRLRSTVTGLGVILLALGLQACAEAEPESSEPVEKTQQNLKKCYPYNNSDGDSCTICFEYVVTRTPYGDFLEPLYHWEWCK